MPCFIERHSLLGWRVRNSVTNKQAASPREGFFKTMQCKYCDFDGEMDQYVGFFKQEVITRMSKEKPFLPKYAFHLGVECPKCKRWQKWLTQDDSMLGIKFYLKNNELTNESYGGNNQGNLL